MNDEFTARQRALTLRLAGRPVKDICLALGRSEFWVHKWCRRYLEFGSDGRYDLTGAHQAPARIPPALERTALAIRRRLQAHAQPQTRYALIGANAILAELSQAFRVGKRYRGLYLRVVLDAGRGWLTAYLNGRVLQRWPHELWNAKPTPDVRATGGCHRLPPER
jgi:hypothetical protein